MPSAVQPTSDVTLRSAERTPKDRTTFRSNDAVEKTVHAASTNSNPVHTIKAKRHRTVPRAGSAASQDDISLVIPIEFSNTKLAFEGFTSKYNGPASYTSNDLETARRVD
jgi:hypothetical protein